MGYRFRIRFGLPEGEALNSEAAELTVVVQPDIVMQLRPHRAKTLSQTNQLTLVSSVYETEKEAEVTGARIRDALLITAAATRIGLNLGDDRAASGFTAYGIREISRRTGSSVFNDVHGMMVVPDEHKILSIGESLSISVGRSPFRLRNVLQMACGVADCVTERCRLAAELYSMSHFETSSSTRFLLLVYSVESLCERQSLPEGICAAIDEAWDCVDCLAIAPPLKASLRTRMRELKSESICAAIVRTLSERLPDRMYGEWHATRLIKKCYDIRSKIAHEGRIREHSSTIRTVLAPLDQLAADFVLASIDTRLFELTAAAELDANDEHARAKEQGPT